MLELNELLNRFVAGSREILGDRVAGIYLHGSAAMGCFNPKKSDVDLIVVLNGGITDAAKRRYMDMVVSLNSGAPAKGIELSLVREDVCRNFVHPTPFELHFSVTHLAWYRSDPEDYIKTMNGTDADLAAHFTVIRRRGRTLWGKEITEVFAEVPAADYLDSIRMDVAGAREEIAENPVYITLNLCRVLAYREENLVLSKKEGGEWGIANVPGYADLIKSALHAYQTDEIMRLDGAVAREYADYMLKRIGVE